MKDEVAEAIASSIAHLVEGLGERSLDEILRRVWLAMSDLEYAAFLASMNLKNKPNVPRRRVPNIESESDVYEIIRTAIVGLERAKQSAGEGAFESVYKEALRVRDDLLRVLEYLEKREKI